MVNICVFTETHTCTHKTLFAFYMLNTYSLRTSTNSYINTLQSSHSLHICIKFIHARGVHTYTHKQTYTHTNTHTHTHKHTWTPSSCCQFPPVNPSSAAAVSAGCSWTRQFRTAADATACHQTPQPPRPPIHRQRRTVSPLCCSRAFRTRPCWPTRPTSSFTGKNPPFRR